MITESNSENIGQLSFIKLGKILFLQKSHVPEKIEKRGKNRVAITFSSIQKANAYLEDKVLHEKQNWTSYIPQHLVSVKGIIRDVDEGILEEEIVEAGRVSDHVKVINAKRMKRRRKVDGKEEIEDLPLMILTFSGTRLPEKVFIYNCSFRVVMI